VDNRPTGEDVSGKGRTTTDSSESPRLSRLEGLDRSLPAASADVTVRNALEESGLDQLKKKEEALRKHQEKVAEEEKTKFISGSAISPSSRDEQQPKTGLDYLRMKEAAFKDRQRRDGVREDQLQRLPELVKEEQRIARELEVEQQQQLQQQQLEAERERQRAMAVPPPKFPEAPKKPQNKVQPDPRRFKKENLLGNTYADEQSEAERLAKLEWDGKQLLRNIKVSRM